MWDCLDTGYVEDRIKNSPLRLLANSPSRIFPPTSGLSSYLRLSFDFQDATPDLIDLAYIRDSLCLVCNEISGPPPPHSLPLVDILNVMRKELDLIEIGGPDYVERTLKQMRDRVKEYDREMQQELLDEAAERFNNSLEASELGKFNQPLGGGLKGCQ